MGRGGTGRGEPGSGGGGATGRAIVQVFSTIGGRVSSFAADFPGWVGARCARVGTADARPARVMAGTPVAPVVGSVAVLRHGRRLHGLPMLRPLNPCGGSFVHGNHTERQDRRHSGSSRRSRYLACLVCHAVFLVIGQSTLASTTCVFHRIHRMRLATRSSANIDVRMRESIWTEVERCAICV